MLLSIILMGVSLDTYVLIEYNLRGEIILPFCFTSNLKAMDTIGNYNALQIEFVEGGCEMFPGFFYKNYSKIIPFLEGTDKKIYPYLVQNETDINEYNRVLDEIRDEDDPPPEYVDEFEAKRILLDPQFIFNNLKCETEGSKAELIDALFHHDEVLSSDKKNVNSEDRDFIVKSDQTDCIYWLSFGTRSEFSQPEIEQIEVWYEIVARKLFNKTS